MEYLVRIIEILVWPGVALIALFVLRRPIADLIPMLQRLKYKNLELEFQRDLDKLREETRDARLKTTLPPSDESVVVDLDYYLQQVRESSPRNAVIEAWLGLESSAVSTATHFKLMPKRARVSASSALKALVTAGVLSDNDMRIINELRFLRNKAVHELSAIISEYEAAKFLEIARDVTDIIAGEAWQKYGGCSG
ncbi:MAG: hypothetical protein ACPHVS_05475 [Alcanivorax sp.]|jgi:hypothetical protein|uniref:hypothetical protein n=1 Tax=Alcanivorax sp. TaxID=1872427 RepID=UPI003C51AF56